MGQAEGSTLFRYPSYVQDIMGDIFSLGFGPFRWVCTSGRPEDLATTDRLAKEVLEQQVREGVPKEIEQQICDNIKWISEAGKHEMVVGSQAGILYSDQRGRTALALRFNAAIAAGEIEGTIVISRDHHDVSGTDSPFRETSNIYDGSAFTADMAVQNCIGDAFRGATWVSLHNGGGVGWGEVLVWFSTAVKQLVDEPAVCLDGMSAMEWLDVPGVATTMLKQQLGEPWRINHCSG